MSTGYNWEGIRLVRATLLGARYVRTSAPLRFVTWGAISSDISTFYLYVLVILSGFILRPLFYRIHFLST